MLTLERGTAHPPLIPGADVHDITSGTWLRYKHDPKRTAEEWDQEMKVVDLLVQERGRAAGRQQQ